MQSLGIPRPRPNPITYTPITWLASRVIDLPDSKLAVTRSVSDALANRRSHRSSDAPTLESLGSLLWQSARTIQRTPSPFGFDSEIRPAPSAGALHPVHLVVWVPSLGNWAWYSSRTHRMHVLERQQALEGLSEEVRSILPECSGATIVFVAEPGLCSAKYLNADSLIWRDSGVLQGTLGIVASALDLEFCLLGITGNPWVERLAEQGKLSGVGVAVVGSKL